MHASAIGRASVGRDVYDKICLALCVHNFSRKRNIARAGEKKKGALVPLMYIYSFTFGCCFCYTSFSLYSFSNLHTTKEIC